MPNVLTKINFFLSFFKGPCHEIFDHYMFCLKDQTWAPYEQAKKVLQTFSFSQGSKISCLHICSLLRHANLSFDKGVSIFLNYCYWVCKHIQVLLFYLIVPLKSVRTRPRCHCHVRIVNNYTGCSPLRSQ